MDEMAGVPQITIACWDILSVSPDAMMCAMSRMVIKRKGAASTLVVPCTLLPYDPRFEKGQTLEVAAPPPSASIILTVPNSSFSAAAPAASQTNQIKIPGTLN